jgi:hypothetical protein
LDSVTRLLDCGACRACCHQRVLLMIGDDPSIYRLDVTPEGALQLQRRPDGACVYLDDKRGCTIYDHRPNMCRRFDCGDWYLTTPRHERRRLARSPNSNTREMVASAKRQALLIKE